MHIKGPPLCGDSDGREKRKEAEGKGNRKVQKYGEKIPVRQMSFPCQVHE